MRLSVLLKNLKEASFSREIESLKSTLFDIFFPPSCIVCGKKIKRVLCQECLLKNSQAKSSILKKLRNRNDIQSFFYLSEYSGDFRKKLLKLKNNRDKNLLRDLSQAFILKNGLKEKDFDYITYVPGRKGVSFHSGMLAERISAITGTAFLKGIIIKKRQTRQLKTLGRKERKSEIKNAFRLNPAFKIKKNSKILIIDDIITTGNTVSEIISLFDDVKVSIGVLGVTPIEKRRKTEKNLAKKL